MYGHYYQMVLESNSRTMALIESNWIQFNLIHLVHHHAFELLLFFHFFIHSLHLCSIWFIQSIQVFYYSIVVVIVPLVVMVVVVVLQPTKHHCFCLLYWYCCFLANKNLQFRKYKDNSNGFIPNDNDNNNNNKYYIYKWWWQSLYTNIKKFVDFDSIQKKINK